MGAALFRPEHPTISISWLLFVPKQYIGKVFATTLAEMELIALDTVKLVIPADFVVSRDPPSFYTHPLLDGDRVLKTVHSAKPDVLPFGIDSVVIGDAAHEVFVEFYSQGPRQALFPIGMLFHRQGRARCLE